MSDTSKAGQKLREKLLAEPQKERLAIIDSNHFVRECVDCITKGEVTLFLQNPLTTQLSRVRSFREESPIFDDNLTRGSLIVGAICLVIAAAGALLSKQASDLKLQLALVGMAMIVALLWGYILRETERLRCYFSRKVTHTESTTRLWLACHDVALQPLRKALSHLSAIRPTEDASFRPEPLHPQLVLAQQDLQILEARQRAGLEIVITLLETHTDPSRAVPYAIEDGDPRPSDQILRDALKLVESAERECCSSTSVRVADEQPPMPGAALYEHLRGTDKKKTA